MAEAIRVVVEEFEDGGAVLAIHRFVIGTGYRCGGNSLMEDQAPSQESQVLAMESVKRRCCLAPWPRKFNES